MRRVGSDKWRRTCPEAVYVLHKVRRQRLVWAYQCKVLRWLCADQGSSIDYSGAPITFADEAVT